LKPGDVIHMMSGKTVEVLNTDAEGRLILADALHYADNDGCDIIIDLATLTGAVMVALGTDYAGLFTEDQKLEKSLLAASQNTGERMWPLPLAPEYKPLLKSHIADIKNIGSRYGGAITAALFLQHFVTKARWAHIDIAGPAFSESPSGYLSYGGTGFAVRTLIRFLEDL
ncbi:MAG: leucyl aminopeptidase family protein, partial [Bdellovibrionales bacterium]|nr:leucyl aminopeptidase family protein [Bdellovibrionales bacterium]